MRKLLSITVLMLSTLLLLASPSVGGRGRGGGGGGRGGMGPGGGGARPGGLVNSYGGGVSGGHSGAVVGPRGGSVQGGHAGGSYTTNRGTTIDAGGAAVGRTGPGGAQSGRYVGGVNVTTPGGREVGKVGHGGAVSGPGGRTVAGREGAVGGVGPNGGIAGRYQGGAAVGPNGGVAGRAGAGVAGGSYGAAAGRAAGVAGYRGTQYRSATAIRSQGVYVRQSVARYPCFRPGWYARYPAAWFAAGWTANAVWRAATWNNCATYCGISVEPAYYDFGTNVVYEDDGVYFNGNKVFSDQQYAEQATAVADAGRAAPAAKDEEWLPLGVFAMVQGDEQTSNHIFQLAVNKQGVLRGNYYDAVTDNSSPVYGSVDKKSQRAAWTVGDRKTPVYEAGIANLTKNETTMVVHYGTERSVQFTLIRIEAPEKAAE